MGIFDFLTGGKGGGVAKLAANANNIYMQSGDRYRALEKLRDDGSEEALAGLLRRFTWNYDKTIEDEQEKESVHDWLVEMATYEQTGGDKPGITGDDKQAARDQRAGVLRALEKSILGADTVSLQLRVLDHVAGHDETWPILERVIAANNNEYVRDPSKKVQLVNFLGEGFKDPRAASALIQYLEDPDETVRFHTVEALLHQANEEIAREPLLKLLVKKEEDSRRIKIRILDVLAETGWVTHGFKGEVEEEVKSLGLSYSIDNKGRIKKPQK